MNVVPAYSTRAEASSCRQPQADAGAGAGASGVAWIGADTGVALPLRMARRASVALLIAGALPPVSAVFP